MSIRGNQVRWSREKSRIPEHATSGQFDETIQSARAREIVEMLVEQIDQTREVLRGRLEPRDRAQLLGALDRLIERERILRQIPAPAPAKQRQQRQAGGSIVPLPSPPTPQ